MSENVFVIRCWGDLACFTSPVTKVERLSLPVPNPSAVRGIFDAIFCKPVEFRWQIKRIEVLNPIQFIALRRNEVKEKISVPAAHKWMRGDEVTPVLADGDGAMLGTDQKGRTQRQTMALKDVRYRFHATIRPWPGFETQQAAFDDQFFRRAKAGKCFCQPTFGMREFPAYFELDEPISTDAPQKITRDLGLMVYDVFDLSKPNGNNALPFVSLFHAKLDDGILEVPEYESQKVLKSEGRN